VEAAAATIAAVGTEDETEKQKVKTCEVKSYLGGNEFNPAQSRDEHGRWTGGGEGIHEMTDRQLRDSMPKYYQTSHIPMDTHGLDKLDPQAKARLDQLDRKFNPYHRFATNTLARFHDFKKGWSPAREELHDVIVEHLRDVPKGTGQPEFVLMGGGSGAGKSFLLKTGDIRLPEHHVHIDVDSIKKSLPEYNVLGHAGDARAASYVHEESSYLGKRAMNESFKAGQNVVLDGTGDSKLESVLKKTDAARAGGLKVRGEYVTCSVDTALKRAADRAVKTGRSVPEAVIRATHASVSSIYPVAVKRGAYDESHLWDNDGKKPVLVASSKGTEMTVHDQKLWHKFLAKAKA
jgi:predicted ABC-type ATPase